MKTTHEDAANNYYYVQQMEATANENQKGISVTIHMCLWFFYTCIIILHESLNFRLKWNLT